MVKSFVYDREMKMFGTPKMYRVTLMIDGYSYDRNPATMGVDESMWIYAILLIHRHPPSRIGRVNIKKCAITYIFHEKKEKICIFFSIKFKNINLNIIILLIHIYNYVGVCICVYI